MPRFTFACAGNVVVARNAAGVAVATNDADCSIVSGTHDDGSGFIVIEGPAGWMRSVATAVEATQDEVTNLEALLASLGL